MSLTNISTDAVWNKLLNELSRPGVSELVANGPGSFFVTVNGVREPVATPAMTEASYSRAVKEGLVPLVDADEEYNEAGYLHEGRLNFKLADGREIKSRCTISLPPIADVPLVTIAVKAPSRTTIDDLALSGSMSTEMLTFLKAAVRGNMTIVLSGPSGAGKTTTLEALTKLFDPNDRIGIAEDTPELTPTHSNVIALRSFPWKPGRDQNSVADLAFVVRQFQRHRTSKLLVGETRGKEFADFLVAANSGHPGSMTTIHASTPTRALDKMARFALAGSDNTNKRSVSEEIAESVDLIIQLGNHNGLRRITSIVEVGNSVTESDSSKITTNPLWEWDPANDTFLKISNPSDSMRQRFNEAGQDIKSILNLNNGHRGKAHSAQGTSTAGGVIAAGPNGPRVVPNGGQGMPHNPLAGGRRAV